MRGNSVPPVLKCVLEAVQTPAEPDYSAPPRRSGGRSLGKPIALTLFALLIAALIAVHLVPLDATSFEKAAAARFGQPVKIGSVHLALFPLPRMRFDKVSVGADAPLTIETVHAVPELATLREEHKAFKSLDLEAAVIPQAWLAGLWEKGDAEAFRIAKITARGAKLELDGLAVPALDLSLAFNEDGSLALASATSADQKTALKLEFKGAEATLDISGKSFALPFGGSAAPVVFEDFSAKGTLKRDELLLNEIEVSALGGFAAGSARLRWRSGWMLDGELALRRGEVEKIAGALLRAGVLEGRAVFSMKAAGADKLLAAPRMEGSFTVQKGTLVGVDLTQVLQSSNASGGSTQFSELNGSAVYDSGRVQARQLRLVAGLLNATGSAELGPQRALSGRFTVELRAASTQARASVSLGGTLDMPQFRRN